MSSNVMVLCEDEAHFWFVRAYLLKLGYKNHAIRRNTSPQGSAQQFVKTHYAQEVNALKSKNFQSMRSLVVMIDADKDQYVTSEKTLIDKLKNELIVDHPRQPTDRIAIFIPVRNIESWIYYIEHNYKKSIDYKEDYKRMVTCKPAKAAQILYDTLCKLNTYPESMPVSLKEACQELQRIKP